MLQRMKLMVDREVCARHGQCTGAAPELFKFDAQGELQILNEHPTGDLLEAAQDAVNICPTQALSLLDE